MDHILRLSYGKDSLACLGAIEELGWPLDRIVHAEVWATKSIPADLPPMVEFKARADAIIKKRWGIEVEHTYAAQTYEDVFYRVRKKSRVGDNGKIYGWPTAKHPWCCGELKVKAFTNLQKQCVAYMGIAADELSRLRKLNKIKKSPLKEVGWTEQKCLEWCKKNDLLSPIYTAVTRGGCWFCHNQSVDQLRLLRRNYPKYWDLMLNWDKDSPMKFQRGKKKQIQGISATGEITNIPIYVPGRTLHDFDRRFQMEDDKLIFSYDKGFRWAILDKEINYRLF